ncbi:hypothetical protein O181_107354 [Austropuccinia psidii MF-1]|uniref:Uncharacterized protein n=1 Tax=Austropuccinia psidii MF-1 TaxID=1389203 RepID=A0A9Q3JTV6_9BASI|nr:hypothetical protein [Austropuccinia psidii MF-1]
MNTSSRVIPIYFTINPTNNNTINGSVYQYDGPRCSVSFTIYIRLINLLFRKLLPSTRLGRSPYFFSPLPPSLIGMDAQSDSSDDHYSTHDE